VRPRFLGAAGDRTVVYYADVNITRGARAHKASALGTVQHLAHVQMQLGGSS